MFSAKKNSRVHGSLYVIAFVSPSLPQRAVVIVMWSSPAHRCDVSLLSCCSRMPIRSNFWAPTKEWEENETEQNQKHAETYLLPTKPIPIYNKNMSIHRHFQHHTPLPDFDVVVVFPPGITTLVIYSSSLCYTMRKSDINTWRLKPVGSCWLSCFLECYHFEEKNLK